MRRWRYVPSARPPEAVVPRLKDGDPSVLICPACGKEVVTPEGFNPWTRRVQRMILLPDRTASSPYTGCGALHWIETEVARRHNEAVYPCNPEVWEQMPDIQELN